MTPILIWGASGHARVVADILRLEGRYAVAGFLDDIHPERRGETFCGAQVLGGREQLAVLRKQGVEAALIAVGDPGTRLKLAELACARGYRLVTAVHPRAVVAGDAVLGEGTVIVAGAIVNPGCWIGRNVILNTASSIDHDCVVEDGVHVAPGACLAGNVVVGRGAWVGIGAVVVERVRIGAASVIGAGAVVVRDLPEGVVAYGVPARVQRKRAGDDEEPGAH